MNSAASSPRPALQMAFGLALTPAVIALAALRLPTVAVDEGWASAIVFAGATATALSSLAVACAVPASRASPLALHASVAGAAALAVLAVGLSRATSPWALVLVDAALVALGWALGSAIGRRIEHPGHLLPACAVVASADLISTVSPGGPTHALASNERVLPLVAVSFPIPGTRAFAPALGVGDLVFIALLLGAAAMHRLPYARVVALCALGIAAAGATSAWLGTAVPALVPISVAVVLGSRAARTLRPKDRKTAHAAVALSMGITAAMLIARFSG